MTIIGAGKIKYFRHQRKPKHKKLKCYEDREKALSLCGYASYTDYLASEDWKKIRDEVLKKFPTCVGCGRKADQVHHLQYSIKVLIGLDQVGLASICNKCHKLIEFDGKVKRDIFQANKVLVRLAIAAGHKKWVAKYTAWNSVNRTEAKARKSKGKFRAK